MINCPLAEPAAVGLNCICRVIDWVGLKIVGRPPPTRVKPAPVILAEFTDTGAAPVEVSVSDCVVDVFIVTLPKLRLPELTVNCGLGTGTLVPLSTTVAVLPVDESLLTINCPFAEPGAVGVNCTSKVIDWSGSSVIGKL